MSARPASDGSPRRAFGPLPLRPVLTQLAVAVAIAALVYLFIRAAHLARVPFLLLLGLAVVVIAAKLGLEAVRPPPTLTHLARDSGEIAYGAPDRPFARARHWEERLDLVRGDAEHFATVVLPELRDLADERLQVAHGLTRASDPVAAEALMGPRLTGFLDRTDRTKPPSQAELAAVVADLEAL